MAKQANLAQSFQLCYAQWMNGGYSGTPLGKKLGITANSKVLLLNPPDEFQVWANSENLDLLPTESNAVADVLILFTEWESQLTSLLPFASSRLTENGGFWIAWPKKASKCPTDITENRLRELLLPTGLVDNKVCAIDEKWSGLRFVWRVEHRGKPKPD